MAASPSVAVAPDLDALRFDERGLLPVVVQDRASGAVLMVAWANRDAVERTIEIGEACFWSRSRRQPWHKGATSGNTIGVAAIRADCDGDTLLYVADPVGPACHRGTRSCFEPNPALLELGWLAEVIEARRGTDAEDSYTARLLASGRPRVAQKVAEEAAEVVIASLTRDGRENGGDADEDRLVEESADLLYHLLVLLADAGVEPLAVADALRRRHREKGSA